MLIDASLQFSSAQTFTSTTASTNIVDFGVNTDLGVSMIHLQFAIYCTAAFTTSGGATLQVQVQGAPNSSGSPGTYVTITETDALAVSALTINAKIPIDLTHRSAAQANALYRFLRLNYVVGTSTMTAGSLTSYLVIDRQDNEVGLFANGYTVAS